MQQRIDKEKLEKRIIIVTFLFVPVLLLLMFTYYPAIKLFQLSLTNWNGYSSSFDYIGLNNFKVVLTNADYYSVFFNNFAYIVSCLLMIVLAAYIAIVLDSGIRAKDLFRTILFIPYVLNGVAVALLFNFLFDFETSPVNQLLRAMNLGEYAIRWISPHYSVNFSLSYVVVWRNLGFYMILFLAALQSIPQELYDSAKIDGAQFREVVFHIILPNIRRVIEITLFLALSTSLQIFYEPFLITGGGPAGRSHTFVTKIVDVAFRFGNFGKASAMGVLLLFVLIIMVSVQRLFLKKGNRYNV